MFHSSRTLGQIWVTLLLGFAGVLSVLLLLSQGASAEPMLDEVNLLITKTVNSDHALIGDQLVYTLTYRNTSTDTQQATGVVLTDTLSPHVTYIAASLTPDGGWPHAPYWNIGTITSTPGGIVLTATVTGPLTNGTTINNVATIESDQTAPTSDDASTTVDAPTLVLTKRDYADPVPTGAPLTYTLTYSNTGDAQATNVAITDVIDSNVTFVSASLSPTVCSTPTLCWDIGTMAYPDYGEIVITVTVKSGLTEGTVLTNTATIDSQQTLPYSQTETTQVAAHGDPVFFTLTPATKTITAGQSISYTLTASDAFGNEWDVTSSGTYTITPGAGGSWDANHYTSEIVGTWTVTATVQATEYTAILTVEPDELAYFTFDSISSPKIAGSSFDVTITAYDAYGNEQTKYAGPAALSDSTGTLSPTTTGGFSNAQWTGGVAITRTGSPVVITATDGSVSDPSAPFTVDPAELDHILLSPSTSIIYAWETQPYAVEAFDVYDNSRGDVTADASFSVIESGHGGSWEDNHVYVPGNHGEWTAQAVYTGTRVTTDTASLTVLAPVLHITKAAAPDPVEAGDHLTYTLTYSNTGNTAATGTTITDELDANVSYVDAWPLPDGGLPDAPFWTVSDVAPGERRQVTITVSVARPLVNGTTLTNVGWISADHVAPMSALVTTTVHSRPVLTITKKDYPDPVTAGGTLRYTFVFTNSGNENATSVSITELYDPNVSFFTANPPPDVGDNVWTFPLLPVDHSESIDIFVQVAQVIPVGTVLDNQVTLDSDQTTPVIAVETTTVTSVSALAVSKLDSPGDGVQAGELLMYVINYQTSGTAPAEDVVITEAYDDRVSFVSADPTPDTGTNNVWTIGDLPVDTGGNIIVTVRVSTPLTNGTVLTNRVTIDSALTSPRSYTETTTVSSTPDLTLDVAGYPDPVAAGDPLTYTLHYRNDGNADATQVIVTATLDANVSFDTASPTPTGGADNTWYWELGKIAGEGGEGEITIRTTVTCPLPNGTVLDLTARLEDAQGDSLEKTIQTTVTSAPVLSLDKDDGVPIVYAGDTLTYTLAYTNSGNENEYSVIITDTLPNYIEYVGCDIPHGDCEHIPPDGDQVVFHIPTLTAHTHGQAHLVVRVDDPLPAGAAFVINHARMTAPSLPAPIHEEDVDSIGTLPDLTVAVEHAPSLFSPGKSMTYTLTYGNAGRMHAENVVITTTLPFSTTYIGHGWETADGQVYTYVVGSLPAGDTGHTVLFTVRHPLGDPQQIVAPEFDTSFRIAGGNGVGEDANPNDNTFHAYVGVPDLIVADFTFEPYPMEPDVPVTFTVVLENQGTGIAWNPEAGAGFFLDIYLGPVSSYSDTPEREGEFFASPKFIVPGGQSTHVITHTGFSEQQVDETEAFYVKVDNWYAPMFYELENPGLYGLVPESNELNNVVGPVFLGIKYTYLPLIRRQSAAHYDPGIAPKDERGVERDRISPRRHFEGR
jgi:uncharacterized repeat protein (TIGR01451 family)